MILATLSDSCTMMYGGAGLMRGRIDNTEDAACVFIFFHLESLAPTIQRP